MNSKNLRNKIINVCKENQKYVDNDKLLITEIWMREGWNESRSLYENTINVSSPETIRRTRQKLVEEWVLKNKAIRQKNVDTKHTNLLEKYKSTRKNLGYQF